MFTRTLLFMAIPIAIQTLLFSSKSFVDTLLLAEVSMEAVSATGIIGRVMLVAIITLLGVSTGGGYVAAQCAQDTGKLNSATLTTFVISLALCALIVFGLLLFDGAVIAMFSQSAVVQQQAGLYLDIVLWSLPLLCFSSVAASYLRIAGYSNWVSGIISLGVLINLAVSAVLIYDYGQGIEGAAYGTLVGGVFEVLALGVFLLIKGINPCRSVFFSRRQFALIREQIVTATSSGLVWSLGAFLFYSFLGRSSPQTLHAISIIIPIESLLLSLTMGIATASSILIGKAIPHEPRTHINSKSVSAILLCIGCVSLIVLLFSLFRDSVVGYFSPEHNSQVLNDFVTLMLIGVVIKSLSIQTMNGVIRSGGDGQFCVKLDIVMQWLIIIPSSFVMLKLGYSALHIYMLVLVEEAVKAVVSLYRFKSGKWCRDLSLA